MLEKLKKAIERPFFQQMKDLRFVGFVMFGCIVLLVSYSGVNVIQTNYSLEKQVAKLEQENQVAELRNNNLKFQNQYYATDQYAELMARKQYGKGAPGETLVLVPKTIALRYAAAAAVVPAKQAVKKPAKPLYQRNLEAWRDFFIHRNAPK